MNWLYELELKLYVPFATVVPAPATQYGSIKQAPSVRVGADPVPLPEAVHPVKGGVELELPATYPSVETLIKYQVPSPL